MFKSSKLKTSFFTILLTILFCFFPFFVLGENEKRGEDEKVVKVKVKFQQKSDPRILTGFIIQEPLGIITALHGIVDSRNNVTFLKGSDPFVEMKLECVNLDSDLAFFKPVIQEEIQKLSNSKKFNIRPKLKVNPGELHFVEGFPYGIELTGTRIFVRDNPLRKLGDIVEPQDHPALEKRGSPNPNLEVIHFEGDLVPGLSGAPIVNQQGAVVAVANGGLREGTTGYVWGTRINTLPCQNEWISPEEVDWDQLKNNTIPISMSKLIGYLPPELPYAFSQKDSHGYIGSNHFAHTKVEIGEDRILTARISMKNEDWQGFCLSPKIFFSDAQGNILEIIQTPRYCLSGTAEVDACRLFSCPGNPITERMEEFKTELNLNLIGQFICVGIIHEPDTKNVFRENRTVSQILEFLGNEDIFHEVPRDPLDGNASFTNIKDCRRRE